MSLLAAKNLLNAILLKDLLLNDVIKWLTYPDSNKNIDQFDCSRGEFALFFLNYLREHTNRLVNTSADQSTSSKVKPPNAIQSQHHNIKTNHETRNHRAENDACIPLGSKQETKTSNSKDFPRLTVDAKKAMRQQCNDILAKSSCVVVENKSIANSSTNRNVERTLSMNCMNRSTEITANSSVFAVPEVENPRRNSHSNIGYTSENAFGSNRNYPRRNVNPTKVESSYSPAGNTLNLGDFITRDNRCGGWSQRRRKENESEWKAGVTSQPRRINPTRLAATDQQTGSGSSEIRSGFGSAIRSDKPCSPFKDVTTFQDSQPDFGQERDLLRLERLKHQANSIATTKSLPLKNVDLIKPDTSLVLDKTSLDILARIYSSLIDANLVLNLSSELCFLIKLIVLEDYAQTRNKIDNIDNLNEDFKLLNMTHLLDSIHNCIYFSTMVLNLQRDLFSLFDRTSLKLLAENTRVSSFNPELWEYLTELYSKQTFNRPAMSFRKDASASNVTFMYETDNKQSFPTEASFHNFKKQRDNFYDVLQVWEKNHLVANWSFAAALGPKIRSLINIHNEPANFIHFARLFRCQLLSTCAGQTLDEEDGLDDDTLKCLKEINPEKYALLRERLVRPQESGVSLRAEFPGQQEFFKEFIVAANSVAFYSHLVDSLATELMTLNDTNFTSSQLDDRATSVDLATRTSFNSCVTSLRLVAKFLGFLVFLPYRSSAVLTRDVALTHAQARDKVAAPVDILQSIQKAVNGGQLVLTIPWVVTYLSMMDTVSITLPYYTTVLQTLFHIYRSMAKAVSETNRIPPSTVSLIKLSLGWLFESPNFPQGLYFSWCSNQDVADKTNEIESSELPVPLDRMDLVDWQALQSLCPHLARLKVVDTSNTARHITPAALQPLASAGDQLQLQLEESFFHGQSSSTRRTVVFVSERVASSCVKHVATLLADQKKLAIGQLKISTTKASLVELARTSASESLSLCLAEVDKYCTTRSKAALPSLLPQDTLDTVLRMCLEIAVRQSRAKAYTWARANINQGVFLKEFESEVDRLLRHTTPPAAMQKTSHVVLDGARGVNHLETASPPPATINALRDCVFAVQYNDGVVTKEHLVMVLDMVHTTILHREDVIPTAEVVLHTLLVDLAVALVIHRPSLLATPVMDVLLRLLTTAELGGATCILSPRTLFMLRRTAQPGSLDGLRDLLLALLRADLLTVPQLLRQCSVALSQVPLPQLDECVADVIRDFKRTSRNSNVKSHDSPSVVTQREVRSEMVEGLPTPVCPTDCHGQQPSVLECLPHCP